MIKVKIPNCESHPFDI